MRPHLLRLALVVVVVVVVGAAVVVVVGAAVAFPDAFAVGGPSTLGAVYLSPGVVFVLVMVVIALRRALDWMCSGE